MTDVSSALDEALQRAFEEGKRMGRQEALQEISIALGKITALESIDLSLSVRELNLSERTQNTLLRGQITTLGGLLEKTEDDLLRLSLFGQKSLDAVNNALHSRGLHLKPLGR
jgi:DNA-directed RNA polymerase alpha subunit